MARTYTEDIRMTFVRNKLFSKLATLKQLNLHDALVLVSGEYLPKSEMIEGSYKVYGGGGLTESSHNQFNVEVETIGIGRVGARCGCVFKISPNSWVTDNALFVKRLKADYDLDFLIHYLNFKNLNQFANTAAQPVISLKRIANITLPVLSIEEQGELVNVIAQVEQGDSTLLTDNWNISTSLANIDSLLTISSELTHQLTLLKQLRQAFLREAMQGKLLPQDPRDEPAAQLLEKIKVEKQRLIQEKKIKKEKDLPPIVAGEVPFEVPEGWVWCRLGEVCQVKVGSTPSRQVKDYWQNGHIPWVSSGEVANNRITTTKERISQKGFDSTSLVLLPRKSVLVAMIGQGKTRGQTAILDIDATINQNIAGLIKYDDALMSEMIWYFFLSRYEITRGGASGGNQPALNGVKISNILFPLPPLAEQQRIVAKLNELMRYCDALEASIKSSQVQNEGLLQQVLREALEPGGEA